ncbi:MAG: hypothetical protein HC817_08260 [Saprospiraceae bacterium]|nr:hypothetical protein [Saprospiraceae bacterium]
MIEPEEMSEPSSISQLLEKNLFTPSVSNAGERYEWQGSRELFEILKKLSTDLQNIPIIQKQCTMNGVMYNATVIEIIISKMSFALVNDQIFTLSDKELFQQINLFIGREKSLFRMMSP